MTGFKVRHATGYRYGHSMVSSQMVVHLVPRATPRQRVIESVISCQPTVAVQHTWIDIFGNVATSISVETPHQSFEIVAESMVEIGDGPPLGDDLDWREARRLLHQDTTDEGLQARWCTLDSRHVITSDGLRDFVQPSFPDGGGIIAGLSDLTRRIFEGFAFDPLSTDVSTPMAEVLRLRRGVCQDFAHIGIGALRSLGLAARYISGYIETEPPPGTEKLIGSDASHAWLALYLPGFGWVDADPTNNALLPDRHVTIAWGRDYADVAPVRGVTFGPPGEQQLTVGVDVTRSTIWP